MAVETVSEIGYVVSWRGILDPDDLLRADGRGKHLGARVAWAQLGGGMIVPGGTLGSMGVGAWMLHRLGMSMDRVGERQFTLMFLNTAVDALAIVFFGAGPCDRGVQRRGNAHAHAAAGRARRARAGVALYIARRAERLSAPLRGGGDRSSQTASARSQAPSTTPGGCCATAAVPRSCSARSSISASTWPCCKAHSWRSMPTPCRASRSSRCAT